MYASALFVLNCVSISSAVTVKWLQTESFNLPQNFDSGRLPCSKEAIVFPQHLQGTVRVMSEIEVAEFILPIDGNIELADTVINVGADYNEVNCTGRYTNFVDRYGLAWNQPDAWSSPRFNLATPDAERIPCFDDDVEFPSDSQFSIRFPDVTQEIRSLKVDGQIFTNEAKFFLYLFKTPESRGTRFIYDNFMASGLDINSHQRCVSRGGCSCQNKIIEVDCSSKYCEKAECTSPVKPIGNCCKICGGYIVFHISENFEMAELESIVGRIVNSYGENKIVYHIGRLPNDKVQIVVVERSTFEGISIEAANEINYQIQSQWILGPKRAMLSGVPISKSGQQLKILVGVLFAVLAMLGALYVYYYRLPTVRVPLRVSTLARLRRRTESVVSLTRRDSEVAVSSAPGRAFRNPLYDSRRGRVQVTESILEE